MEWIADPAAWLGLVTLVALEVVLGVDNLIFIAILSDKLPPAERNRARVVGLSLALFMRLGLLASISWVMSLTAPLFALGAVEISWRDLILIVGGGFLLVKATIEIHERLEARGERHEAAGARAHAAFWPTIAQIIVLDIVFSLDSVITAVGMVNELEIMMIAVVVAVALMLFASRPLTAFILKRPSLIILCLGFLLMVGLVLVVDGFGIHVPKGYVYAAIGFSLLVELLNQWGERNRRRTAAQVPAGERMVDTVLKMLAGVPPMAFAPEQRHMVREALTFGEQRVTAAMTPRDELVWVDAGAPPESLLEIVRRAPHREFPVGRGSLDRLEGVVRKEDVLAAALDGPPRVDALLRKAVQVPEHASLLRALRCFKEAPIELVVIVGADGGVRGIVTRTDLLEAIAGELPDLD
jgi:predicted tellurium resistance membrane protein TerC/CBS domain-containing protein